MVRLMKPHMPKGTLQLQDDHYWRVNDICFRHLAGSYEHYQMQLPHRWIKGVKNDDPRFGRSEYMKSRSILGPAESEEYTHAIASTLFAHVWVLSAANYFRLAIKTKKRSEESIHDITPIKSGSPREVAQKLGMSEDIYDLTTDLKCARDTIVHMIEDDGRMYPLDELGFEQAYRFVQCSWDIYIALLKYYGRTPDEGHWEIQTRNHGLPSSIDPS